jgi:hypothetical protein
MEAFIEAVLDQNGLRKRSTYILTWKFKWISIVVENELREDTESLIIFKKIYLWNPVCCHRCRSLLESDVNNRDDALSVAMATVPLTIIFFNWTKALGAEMIAIVDLLSQLASSSRANISAVSCEYFHC